MILVYVLISFIIGVLTGLFILRIVQVTNRAHGSLIFNTEDPEKEFMTIQFSNNVEDLMTRHYVELVIVKDIDVRQKTSTVMKEVNKNGKFKTIGGSN